MHAMVSMWREEDLWESVLSLHHVGRGTELRWSCSVEMPLPPNSGRPENVHVFLKITKRLVLFFLKVYILGIPSDYKIPLLCL